MYEICSMRWVYFGIERWKNIKIDNKKTGYKVSNFGNVKNKRGKLLSGYYDRDGYVRFTLSIHKRPRHFFSHRLVAEAFLKNVKSKDKTQVNHIDGIKDHNIPSNLEWCTASYNVAHAFMTGLKHSILGEENVLSVYSENTIREICKMLSIGISNKIISEKLKVNQKYITDIKKGRRWKHISSKYMPFK